MQVSSSDVVEVGELLQPRLQKVILVKLDYFDRLASVLHANYATRHTMRGRSSGDGSEPLDLAQGKDLFPKDDTKANSATAPWDQIRRFAGSFNAYAAGAVINWPRTTADASRRSRMSVSCFCAPNDRLAIVKRTNPRLTRYLGSERELDFIGCLTRRSVGCADSFPRLLRVPLEAF